MEGVCEFRDVESGALLSAFLSQFPYYKMENVDGVASGNETETVQVTENSFWACSDAAAQDAEALLARDLPTNSAVHEKLCSRGFSEAEWNEEEYDDDLDCPKMKTSSDNVNGCMGEVDKLDSFVI